MAAMSVKNFTIDIQDDGAARLSLSYKGGRAHGISRISSEAAPKEMVQLVLFDAAIDLRNALGAPRSTELVLDGLVLRFAPLDAGQLSFERRLGFSSQTAFCPLTEFHGEMAQVADVCLGRAETSKHGGLLKDILAQCPIPAALSDRMDPDVADQMFHRLCEMAFLILAEDIASRGSVLARKLRGKTTQQEAAGMVTAVLQSLVREFAYEPNMQQGDGSKGRPV